MGVVASLCGNGQVVAAFSDIGKAHASPIPEFPDFFTGCGPPLGHGKLEIGDTRTSIDDLDADFLLPQVTDDPPPIGMGDYIDFRLKDCDDDPLDQGRGDVELFEQPLQVAGC